MLSEEKKSLIEAEERFRHEAARKIRAELGAIGQEIESIEKSFWGKVSDLLNSNVGMWFLSSVLITGGAGAYQIVQHHYEVQLRNRTQLITHQFEIGNRIQNMKYFLRKAKTIGDAQFALKSVFQSKTPVSPDVEKLSLSVLYFNQYQLRGTENKEVLELVRQLEDQEYLIQNQKASDLLSDDQKEKLISLINNLEKIQLQESKERS